MRSITAGQNVAEKNRTKAVGRLRFFGARTAVGGERKQTCYAKFGRFTTFSFSKILDLLQP
jgi:hypothetical protein